MKIIKQSALVERWQVISTILTNRCRDQDSVPTGEKNHRLQCAMVAEKGWSLECPAIFVPMSNWLFSECTAQAYVDDEIEARRVKLIELSGDPKRAVELAAFRAAFCNDKGDLHKLTVKNAFWAFSGHQRLQYVFTQAHVAYLEERSAAEEANKKAGIPFEDYPPFSLTIPCSVREYDSTTEITLLQMEGNEQQSIQNSLTTLDLVKCARELIGNDPLPKMNESQFRKGCARAGTASAGDASRFPWLVAEFDHAVPTAGLYAAVMSPAELVIDGKKVPNPDHVPLSAISVKNKVNPIENISVVSRLIERDLSGLKSYANNSKTKDNVSALERGVLDRGYPWDKVEAKAWVDGRKPNHPNNAGKTLVTTGDKAMSLVSIKEMKKQPAMPEVVGLYLDAIVRGDTNDKRLNDVCAAKDILDASYKLASDKRVAEIMSKLSLLKDGDAARFNTVVEAIENLLK